MATKSSRNSLSDLQASLILFFCCFCLRTNSAAGEDTISFQQPLSGNQTIVSKGGIFELGFFTPGKSQNYYIGIWYKKRPERTVVWVANRETAVSSATNSELTISRDGNLVLLDKSKNQIWSSNLTSIRSNSTTVAVLLDTGNFVLTNQSDSSMIYWQSFDHPTDSWLPGGRVGWNNITKQYMTLVSWRSEDDPASGSYSFGMDPTGTDQLVQMWNGTEYYWQSGGWNGQYFSSVPELTRNQVFKYIYNESLNSVTYTIDDAKVALVTRFQASVTGLGIQWAWLNTTPEWIASWSQPKLQCQVYSFCGPFSICADTAAPVCSCLQGFEPASKIDWDSGSWKGGCVRRTKLLCETNSTVNVGQEDKFLMIPNMQLPVNPEASPTNNSDQCQVSCLSNCSCVAYSYNGNDCLIWSSGLVNLRPSTNSSNSLVGDVFLRLAASELQDSSNGVSAGVIAGAVVGGVVLCLVLVLVVMWILCRKRRQTRTALRQTKEGGLVVFSYRELEHLTKNFSERLGGGGFGSVFKGVLPDNNVIAVKKLEGLRQGEKQFRAEVSTMGTIQHVNLVRLRGFCCEGDKRLLVYDFMPNGSLDSYLTDNHAKQTLGWKQRYQIAIGTARGLAYLHEQCRDCIMHCDIKPENILLDKDLCPKVSDFGMAKLMGRDFSRVMTTMRGTVGYLAPEWITGLPVTPKADVYSYGMVLFELISGKRNATVHEDEQVTFFPVWATKRVVEGDDVLSLLDKSLHGDADIEELGRVSKVACWCIQDEESERPSMGQVVQMLEGVVEIQMPPIPNTLHRLLNDESKDAMVFYEDPRNVI
ncbi:S-receptor-like serine/threonine-protein kinase protein [Dioscorea alata]|uniref:S-receptor-like serine/threonine-protein kinase protein n=1 Tax=Dioscorea alata TaxID=55571 RepID=A0ACB7VNZ6_DIOAL|nr:S-receptor-like serine/threonine-protein kinase protein [Dioscorea alata]